MKLLNRPRRQLVLIAVALVTAGLTIVPLLVSAATPSGYQIVAANWDGGGGRLEGTNFNVTGAAGQPDAGILAGPSFTVYGGFIQGARSRSDTNCDGKVDATDSLFVLRVLAGLATPVAPCTIDADGSGSGNPADAIQVLRVIGKLTPDLEID